MSLLALLPSLLWLSAKVSPWCVQAERSQLPKQKTGLESMGKPMAARSVSLERGSLLTKREQRNYWAVSNLGQCGSLEHKSKDSSTWSSSPLF